MGIRVLQKGLIMERTTNFINETDYKKAWEWERDENARLREKVHSLEAEIESWKREVSNLNSAADKLEATIERKDKQIRDMGDLINRLNGELTAFRFCVTNWGVGD